VVEDRILSKSMGYGIKLERQKAGNLALKTSAKENLYIDVQCLEAPYLLAFSKIIVVSH